MTFVNLFYKYDDASVVPIFDGKIDSVVKDIKDLRTDVEKRFEKVDLRLKKLEKQK